MRVDTLAVRLRHRTPMEAADLGVRLCQHAARSVFGCHAVVAVPVAAIALASYEISGWLPYVVLWWTKPWVDRTSLFALSRAAFDQRTTPGDLWRAQRHVWWSHWIATWTVRRLSPWRSLTQPVYQLEGTTTWRARTRAAHVRRKTAGAAFLVTAAFGLAEFALALALCSLVFWMAPADSGLDPIAILSGDVSPFEGLPFVLAASYAAVVVFLEPFYVGAGFAMYLNRRAALEAWDLEQELRRAFAA